MFAPVEPPENFANSGLERKGWARKKKWKRGSREDDLYFKVGKHVLDMSTKPNCPFLSSFRYRKVEGAFGMSGEIGCSNSEVRLTILTPWLRARYNLKSLSHSSSSLKG